MVASCFCWTVPAAYTWSGSLDHLGVLKDPALGREGSLTLG